jgi:hypothetical protein
MEESQQAAGDEARCLLYDIVSGIRGTGGCVFTAAARVIFPPSPVWGRAGTTAYSSPGMREGCVGGLGAGKGHRKLQPLAPLDVNQVPVTLLRNFRNMNATRNLLEVRDQKSGEVGRCI